jgi:hypothetical protein
VAQRVGRGIALLFQDLGTRRDEWSAARPGRNLPPGKTRYPLYRRLGGSQGRSGQARKLIISCSNYGWNGVCRLSIVKSYTVKMEAAIFFEMLLST